MMMMLHIDLPLAAPRPMDFHEFVRLVPAVNMPVMLHELSAFVDRAVPHRHLTEFSLLASPPDMVPWLTTWSKEAHSVACSVAHKARVRTALLVMHKAQLPSDIAVSILAKTV